MRPGHCPQVICRRAGIGRDLYWLRLPASDTSLTIIGASGALGFGLALRLGARRRRGDDRLARRRTRRGDGRAGCAQQVPNGRLRRPRERAGRSGQRDRRAERPVSQPLGDAHQHHAGRCAAGSSCSTRRCRWPPPSAARRRGCSASGRARRRSRRRRWFPRACASSSGLHTVSAALLSDLEHRARRGRPDRAATAARTRRASAALIEQDRRPARGRLRAPRDGADRRVADGAADRDQRALQGARRAARHRACPTRSGERRPAVGRDRRREARARPLRHCSATSSPWSPTPRDDIEIYGAYVSPDPDLSSYWLADRIDERGWGIAGDSFER